MSQYKYILAEPVWHQTPMVAPAPFANEWLAIMPGPTGTRLDLFAGWGWDGATGVPDAPGTFFATAFHDAVYTFCEAIAAAWGWTVREVIEWADRIFRERMVQDGAHWLVVRLYYRGVRLLGYGYHEAAKKWRGLWGLAALRSQRRR